MARQRVPSPKVESKIRRISKELPVSLTQGEWEKAVNESVAKSKDVKTLEAAKKERNKDYTDRIQTAKREHTKLEKMVETRTAERPVECEEEFDFEHKAYRLRRADNGAVLEERAMTAGELEKHSQVDIEDRA